MDTLGSCGLIITRGEKFEGRKGAWPLALPRERERKPLAVLPLSGVPSGLSLSELGFLCRPLGAIARLSGCFEEILFLSGGLLGVVSHKGQQSLRFLIICLP